MATRKYEQLVVHGGTLHKSAGVLTIPTLGDPWFVDTVNGKDERGTRAHDPSQPLKTMAEALDRAQTMDTIFFVGDVREELTGSNLKFDITIVGLGRTHHPDLPAAGYHPGASCWRPPASPTSETPLIKVRGRGWRFINILFDCPVDSAALYLERNAESGDDEYDASHAIIQGCRFTSGKYGIQDVGGCGFVTVEDNVFMNLNAAGGCGIINTSTAVALPLMWHIRNNRFPAAGTVEGVQGNQSHIVAPFASAIIHGNHFGTVESTGLYVDLTNGQDNLVTGNYLGGAYEHSDYQDATGDIWAGNFTIAGVTTANPAA